jgi:dCMP deaminase
MRIEFDDWLVEMAKAASLRARDPSTKVGAVVVRPDKSVAAIGYNWFPRSMEDRDDWYADRSEKYDRVIHAEMNALLSMKEHARGCTVAITHPPCKDCAKHLAAAGIKKVVWRHCPEIEARFDTTRSQEILKDSGVESVILLAIERDSECLL